MEFRLLGPLEVIEDGRPVPLGPPKQRMLLAVLLLRPNEVVSNDELIDAPGHAQGTIPDLFPHEARGHDAERQAGTSVNT